MPLPVRRLWSVKRVVLTVAVVALALFAGVSMFVYSYFPTRLSSSDDDPAYVWLSMVLATSSPSWDWFRRNFSPFLFSVSLTVHILLNVGSFFAVLWFVVDAAVTNRRGRIMDLANAVGVRDAILRSFVLSVVQPQLPTEAAKDELAAGLNRAFSQASEEWEKYLVITMGETSARQVMELMKHSI